MPIKLSLSTSDPFSIPADIVFVGIPEGTSEHEGVLAVLPGLNQPRCGERARVEAGNAEWTVGDSLRSEDHEVPAAARVGRALGHDEETAVEADVVPISRHRARRGGRAGGCERWPLYDAT